MIIPDKFARTVHLSVIVTDGYIKMADGSPLPKLRKGTSGELVILAHTIVDAKTRLALTSETLVPFLPPQTILWAKVRPESIPGKLQKFREPKTIWPVEPGHFVAFELKQDLQLIRRGSKLAFLHDCTCHIPALATDATSVNEAYTKISTAFEPTRRSHSGNVFQKVYVEREARLHPLDESRISKESEPLPNSESAE